MEQHIEFGSQNYVTFQPMSFSIDIHTYLQNKLPTNHKPILLEISQQIAQNLNIFLQKTSITNVKP